MQQIVIMIYDKLKPTIITFYCASKLDNNKSNINLLLKFLLIFGRPVDKTTRGLIYIELSVFVLVLVSVAMGD